MKVTTLTDLKEGFYGLIRDWTSDKFIQNLKILEKEKKIELIVEKIDCDLEAKTWDGALYLKLKKIKTDELVNYVLDLSRADEMSIQDKTLRLWWD